MDDLEYGNLIAAGEFLLGYENEYGLFTQRPLLDPALDPEDILSPAQDDPGRRDFGRNGCYLVLRQLEQDVAGFWQFLRQESPDDDGVSLGEAMVGRRLSNGDPLITATRAEIRGVDPRPDQLRQNGFTLIPIPKDWRARSVPIFAGPIRGPPICRAAGKAWYRGCCACWV